MKILLIHTFYQMQGGEDSVFNEEYLLLSKDNQVEKLEFHNKKGFLGAMQFVLSIWNFSAMVELNRRLKKFKPDIIHIHNLHFAIGPLAIRFIKKANIPIILTLHNYRLICPSAILHYDGRIFNDSLNEDFPWKAIIKGVYRNSVFQTFWLALTVWFHKKIGTWKLVNKYIVLTEFAKDVFTKSRLKIPGEKFIVKPNFAAPSAATAHQNRSDHFLFVGRLSKEKGVETLLSAFKSSKKLLRIAGDGELRELVIQTAHDFPNIQYLGRLNKSEIMWEMGSCTALVFPSTWYEGMPMTIIEALSCGTPVIASNLGAMTAMIKDNVNGLLFVPNDHNSLLQALNNWSHFAEEIKIQFSQNAKKDYIQKYTPEINKLQLLRIYQDIVSSTEQDLRQK